MIRAGFLLFALGLSSPVAASTDSADRVDVFMGTRGDRGQLSPAAAAPFGMIQLAPDTTPANHIGYDRDATALRGFSQTRAQGVGCDGGGGDLLTSVAYAGEPAPAPIDKASESGGAGWYRVTYGRTPIAAHLVAGQSVSVSQFRASAAGTVVVALDPTHSYAKHVGHDWLSTAAADLRLTVANATVCDRGVYRLGIAGRLLLNGRPLTARGALGQDGIVRFSVAVRPADRLELRIALSTVDAASARQSLADDLGARPIEALAAQTRAAWSAAFSRIAVQPAGAGRSLFYTAMFRALQMPARVDDSRGAYRDADGRLRHVPRGRHRYAGWSLWDNYRTQMPLLALAAPDVARDVADSLAELYVNGKRQWAGPTEPFLSVRTEHAGIALLDLRRKGLGGAGAAAALPAMAKETSELPSETPDQKLENAYDEWAVAELASDLGRIDVARDFRARALAYRPMWQKVFRDLGDDGDVVKARGLYQGTLWQYRWAPVFDLTWLRDQGLGMKRFDSDLAAFFDRKLFNMTNEPDIHVPFLFTLTGNPARADALVARLRDAPIEHWYENKRKYARPFVQPSFALDPGFAEGMDDDGGAMSAWYVWATIGLYPLVPGEPWYAITLPGAREVRLDVGGGRRFVIETRGPASATRIATMTLNSLPLTERRLSHAALTRGGNLVIEAR